MEKVPYQLATALVRRAIMNISIKAICRGNGKYYLGIKTDTNILESSTTRITVNGKNGAMPFSVFPIDSDLVNYVLAAPLPISKHEVLIETIQPTNKCSFKRTFDATQLKWVSRIQGKMNKGLVNLIRNSDEKYSVDPIEVSVLRLIKNNDYIIFHIKASYVISNKTEIKSLEIPLPPSLQIQDGSGKIIPANTILLQNRTETIAQYPQGLVQNVVFSTELPLTNLGYVFSVICGENQGFTVVNQSNLQKRLADWLQLTTFADRDTNYDNWFRNQGQVKRSELQLQQENKFKVNPLFSIVVPLYNTPSDFFFEMYNSVMRQSYRNFELILVNSTPENDQLRTALSHVEGNSKVKIITLEKNLGITENTNYGIEVARGDFICFLDHDDVLEPNALYEYTLAINSKPTIDLLYCDEDKLLDDTYVNPYFKPDFSLDLLRSINYICHFLCIRSSIVMSMEKPTNKYDGAQDYNMTLWAAENARAIHHVSRILYHWRIHENSTAQHQDEKPYAHTAAKISLQEHLDRIAQGAIAINSKDVPYYYSVSYPIMNQPLVSIIIPNKDHIELLDQCIQSLRDTINYPNYEIIIVENNSTNKDTFDYYNQLTLNCPNIQVLTWDGSFNFSSIMNYAASKASGTYYLFLNNDVQALSSGWFEHMLGIACRNEVGAVGAKLYFPDMTIQHAGISVNFGGGPGHINYLLPKSNTGYFNTASVAQNLSAVTGACMMLSKSNFEYVNGFDERFAGDYNDVDLCLKLREAGLYIVFDPRIELIHYESISRGSDSIEAAYRHETELALFRLKWPKYFVEGDEYWNINLDSRGGYYCLSK